MINNKVILSSFEKLQKWARPWYCLSGLFCSISNPLFSYFPSEMYTWGAGLLWLSLVHPNLYANCSRADLSVGNVCVPHLSVLWPKIELLLLQREIHQFQNYSVFCSQLKARLYKLCIIGMHWTWTLTVHSPCLQFNKAGTGRCN